MVLKDSNHKDFAVLYRTNAQSRAIEAKTRHSIQNMEVFLLSKKEVKDLLSYFRVVINPRDEEL